MKVIEYHSELQKFLRKYSTKPWIIVPTYSNGSKSPYQDSLCVLYVYTLFSNKDALLVFNHTEGESLGTDLSFLDSVENLFVYDKKSFSSFYQRDDIVDLSLLEWYDSGQVTLEEIDTTAHNFFLKNYSQFSDLNTLIPIYKHAEKSYSIVEHFLELAASFEFSKPFSKFNTIVLDSLYYVESSGLCIDKKIFSEKIKKTDDSIVYSEYNPYTITGRPSNRRNGVNYAALKKDDESRKAFVSRWENGFLISADFESYHLRLLSELVQYHFPENESIHEHLAKQYFETDTITPEQYNESKARSFQIIYGGVPREYLRIPFFKKVHEYTEILWQLQQSQGYVETNIFGRHMDSSYIKDSNPSKLLNYVLQSYETERNMLVIQDIKKILQSYETKLILYTYDSFLFDYNPNDGIKLFQELKKCMSDLGNFPIKFEVGRNYHEMSVADFI